MTDDAQHMDAEQLSSAAPDAVVAERLRDFYNRPGFLIRRANQVIVASFLERMGAIRLTPTQFAALVVVSDEPGIDQITLSRRLGIDRTNTSMVVNGLSQNGWLHSIRAPQDGRRNLLTATRAGEASMLMARDIAIAHGAELAALLPEGDLRRLSDMLRRLVTDLNTSAPPWQRPDGTDDLFDLAPLRETYPGQAALFNAIGFVTRRAQQLMESAFMDAVGIAGMTPRRAGAIYVISLAEPVEQLSLARWLALDNSTMATVVGDLVKRGFVARRTHPHDKRRRLLSLTPAGIAMLNATSAKADRSNQIALDALGGEADAFIILMQHFLLVTQDMNRVALHPAALAQNRAIYG